MKKLLNEEGKCPFCGSEDLAYEGMEPEDDMVYYPWTCEECGRQGEEWYNISFAGHNIETEDGSMIDVDSLNNKLTDDKKEESKTVKLKCLRKTEGIKAVEEYEYEFEDLYDIVGENGKSTLDDIKNANKEEEFMNYLLSIMGEDIGRIPSVAELSDFIDYDFEKIYEELGIDL